MRNKFAGFYAKQHVHYNQMPIAVVRLSAYSISIKLCIKERGTSSPLMHANLNVIGAIQIELIEAGMRTHCLCQFFAPFSRSGVIYHDDFVALPIFFVFVHAPMYLRLCFALIHLHIRGFSFIFAYFSHFRRFLHPLFIF